MIKMQNDGMTHTTREIIRAVDSFFWWFRRGNTPQEAELKVRSSYNDLIGDMVMYYIAKNI